MTLKGRFRFMVAVAATGLLILAAFWLRGLRSSILVEKQEQTENLVAIPYSILTEEYRQEQNGEISRTKAQKRALELIRGMRYQGQNYFWINDMHPAMVMHPLKPELDGRDLTDFKDPSGKALFVESVKVVRANGSGFVSYMWAKPGNDKPVPKLSFVKGFEPWGWVIGTGIYVDDVNVSVAKSGKTAGAVALACLAVLLLVSTSISRSIFRRLNEMIERIKDVAEGEGDLTKRIEVTRDDEVAELARWFNTFIDKLHEILTRVASNTESLTATAKDVAASSREHAQGVESQRSQADQVATAMQEMSSTVQQVSENSNNASAASQKAAESARTGGKVVEETLSRMRAIAESVGATARQVQELGKRSDQIGQIIGVIDEIADQTNLLALNAAIEAARAGEQGRGFAVVADEVRKLAERTGKATKEIAEMIRTIQSETKNVVTAMQAGTKEVELGVESTTLAGSSLHEIIETNLQVNDMIAHIATAATEQAAATEQINKSITEIARITSTSATVTQQSQQALEDLSELAQNLQGLVQQFRLSSGGDGDIQGRTERRTSHVNKHVAQSVDFARVKMAHRSWRIRLRRFLDGSEDIDPAKLGSHQQCELGKWIYADAMPNHGDLPDVQALESKHKGMHTLVKEVVELKHAGKAEEAEQEFVRVTHAADEVVDLISKVERQLSGSTLARAASAS